MRALRDSGPRGSERIAPPGVPHDQPGRHERVKNITCLRKDPCECDCRSIDAIRNDADGYRCADGF